MWEFDPRRRAGYLGDINFFNLEPRRDDKDAYADEDEDQEEEDEDQDKD
jgi:hypothetical protein